MQMWTLQLKELFKISLKIQFVVLKENKKQYSFSREYTLNIHYTPQNT